MKRGVLQQPNLPQAKRLHRKVGELLRHLDAWTTDAAQCYASLRYQLEREGESLSPMSLLIAAHALKADCTLITNDQAFKGVKGLKLKDWTKST